MQEVKTHLRRCEKSDTKWSRKAPAHKAGQVPDTKVFMAMFGHFAAVIGHFKRMKPQLSDSEVKK